MIYVVEILERKFIKIGFANNVSQRIAELQTGNPFKINVVWASEGTLLQEQEIHRTLTARFGRIHVSCPPNEWYPGRLPLITNFIEEFRISVTGAIAFANSYGNGNKKWMGGVRNKPKHEFNDTPKLVWPSMREFAQLEVAYKK